MRAVTVLSILGTIVLLILMLNVGFGMYQNELEIRVDDRWRSPPKQHWSSGAPIPKKMFQILLAPYRQEVFADQMQTWRERNKGWEFYVMRDADAAHFVQKHYPEWWPTFRILPKPILKADVLRYMLIHTYGGVYSDVDSVCLRAIDHWSSPSNRMAQLVVAPEDNARWLCMGTFCAAPGHPFLRAVLDSIHVKMSAFDFSKKLTDVDVYEMTGPRLFTSVFERVKPQALILPIDSLYGTLVTHTAYGKTGSDGWKKTLFALFG